MNQGQTSIGSGSGNDSNENRVADATPSRTLGAESGGGQPPRNRQAPTPVADSPDDAADATEQADETPHAIEGDTLPGPLAGAIPVEKKSADQVFPDGPNVAPSPWEKDAAEGKA